MICKHWVEAIVKLLISALPAYFLIRLIPKMLAGDPAWWKISLIVLSLGFLVGMGIGSLIGGLYSLCFNIPPRLAKSP